MTLIQKLALLYAAMFFFVAFMGYVPGWTDESGALFGLFTLDFHDNLLHFVSGLWALIAGLMSERQATIYFKLFGSVYCLDGVVGLFLGNAFLDLGLFLHGPFEATFVYKFLTNIPHILIGGSQMFCGFILARRYGSAQKR